MAQRARLLGRATFGLSCTGLAGPGTAGSAEPIGTVFTAVAAKGVTRVTRHRFPGDRGRVQRLAARATAEGLRRFLIDELSW